jgi:hypothetical protein
MNIHRDRQQKNTKSMGSLIIQVGMTTGFSCFTGRIGRTCGQLVGRDPIGALRGLPSTVHDIGYGSATRTPRRVPFGAGLRHRFAAYLTLKPWSVVVYLDPNLDQSLLAGGTSDPGQSLSRSTYEPSEKHSVNLLGADSIAVWANALNTATPLPISPLPIAFSERNLGPVVPLPVVGQDYICFRVIATRFLSFRSEGVTGSVDVAEELTS